jgi:hypothetical protein
MTFFEQMSGVWVCDNCNGALLEETIRGIKEQGMLEKCPRCGADASGTKIDEYPDNDSETRSRLRRFLKV